MLIESIIKRAGGTEVPMPVEGADDITYHFKPQDGKFDSPHVAEVANEAHAARFLAITEGFKIPGAPDPVEIVAPVAPLYTGLAAIDPDSVSNKWLTDYAHDVMGIDGPSKPRLADKLKQDFGVDMNAAVHTAADIIREHVRHAAAEDRSSQDYEREQEREREHHAEIPQETAPDAGEGLLEERTKRPYNRKPKEAE